MKQKMINKGSIIIVMGVSGSGKSTVGKLLAKKLNLTFRDADDYHPPGNIQKMASGKSLNDEDRKGWLHRLNELMRDSGELGIVLACSALKESYRTILAQDIDKELVWIYLDGDYEEILARMQKREEHFMPAALLRSQFDTLEVPSYAIPVSISNKPDKTVELILEHFS
ncbi:MAG: gluconokinase [Flavobacteriaceae bacterium]